MNNEMITTFEDFFTYIKNLGKAQRRNIDAQNLINKIKYNFSELEKELENTPLIESVFISEPTPPYKAYGGGSFINTIMQINKIDNIFKNNPKEELEINLSSLKLAAPKLIILAENNDKAALEISSYTEHALTLFVKPELFAPNDNLVLLPNYLREINKKIRRYDKNNLANRDRQTYY